MPRVLVLDPISQDGLDLLDAAPGIEYEIRTKLAGEDLRQALAEFDGAVCRSGVKITAESMAGNKRLKAIVRAGVGTDNIDKNAATRAGIVVMNTPTGNTISTAEHAFTLMLALSRNVAAANQSLIEGRWDRKEYMGAQLAGKTLGVVGVGRIGVEVAKRAQAFQMKVIGFDPFLTAERAAELHIEKADSVEDLLKQIDYLTVHTPGGTETKDLISMESLEIIKPGARLINCARGGIYNEAALVAGLKSGKLAGVALDVFEEEPCTNSPLFGMPGVTCTPHLGASTEEAQTQVAIEACQLLVNYLTTGEIRHAVNVASIDPKTLASMRGFINAAYRLGLLLAQWHGGAFSSCTLNYRGEVTQKDTKLLTSAFCAGLLEKALDDEANIVNAEVLLRERGAKLVAQSQSEMGAFTSSMTVEVSGDGKTHTAGVTLFGNNMPRLIRLNDYRLESYLDGFLAVFTHDDVPGIIGRVGTALGRHSVNIAQMAVGRAGESPGGKAIGVLNLDSMPPQEALDEMVAEPGVNSVQVIELPPAGQEPPWLQ
ncbi:phosphoglycerate dehydrogenase [Lignipirellula cremea]|uniref:D-3-phosphoglycerate dehydrogenase n=1 Tax=Lignipirellula cremea TaxID=2528010 RepID=A0A518DPB2_9BACT|nr:phosphoglycerate dehydrogenase [Lignipirellula cremea]QDU93666.1 D-3-phosphoglycerate dehydrogenase [Lignipirellula cremea]